MQLEIFNFRSGQILNYTDGKETDDYLEIKLEGIADSEAFVTINGGPTTRMDTRFGGTVKLTKRINEVEVVASSQYGDLKLTLTLVWDKKSYKRYNFFIDDHSFFLTDIAKERPKSLFDHFYLAALRKIHQDYGTRFTLNCFYRNDHFPFEMKEVPDTYKSEFEDNANWLRLAFHAYSEFPDRPYQHASAAKLAADYDLVASEIVRFAGEKTLTPPVVLHWGMARPDAFGVLHDRGVRVLEGQFLRAKTYVGEENPPSRVADVGYFYEKDVTEYLASRYYFYDRFTDMFLYKSVMTVNLVKTEQVQGILNGIIANPLCNMTVGLASHEQYSFPYYKNYQPDHVARLGLAAKTMTEAGYTPAHFADGLLGSTAWD